MAKHWHGDERQRYCKAKLWQGSVKLCTARAKQRKALPSIIQQRQGEAKDCKGKAMFARAMYSTEVWRTAMARQSNTRKA